MHLTIQKISLSLIIVFFIQGVVFSQVNEVDNQGRKQGEWMKYFANSENIRYKGQFKDDQPVGKFTYYFPSGAVRAIISHDKNSERSEAYFYYKNKTLAEYGIYKSENKDSVWVHYTPNGDLSYKQTYKNGKANGEKVIYYKPEVSGNSDKLLILRKVKYKNGEPNGDFIEYFPDGVVKAKGMYKNGSLDGVIMKYHPNGKKMMLERWKNRKKHGWWITYDKSGKEVGRKYFLNNQPLEGDELKEYMKELKEKGINPNK